MTQDRGATYDGMSVGELARLTGVTVRTLHHYDEIGLLRPSGRSAAGYRLYSEADVDRLQRVLGYRELGLGLEQVAALLDDPAVDAGEHLVHQRERLVDRIEHLRRVVAAIDRTLEAEHMGIRLSREEQRELFGDYSPEDHEPEAEERWGDTDAWRQSRRRTSSYSKEDWQAITAEAQAVNDRLAAAMDSGAPADSPEAMAAAEAHREHISRWFYDCPYQMHRGLGDMYVGDERFRAHYEQHRPGLAEYVRDAIHANAAHSGAG